MFTAAAAVAAEPALKSKVTPIEVTPRVFYVQGQPGVASAANEGYNSNAGFVITDEADSKRWLERIARLLEMKPRVMVTGHGAVSREPARDLALTRDYLIFLREAMGKAVEELVPFEEVYARTDWSRFAKVPAFEAANRVIAYGQYLQMERELLKRSYLLNL